KQEAALLLRYLEPELLRRARERGGALRHEVELPLALAGEAGERKQVDTMLGEARQHLRTLSGGVGHHDIEIVDFAYAIAHVVLLGACLGADRVAGDASTRSNTLSPPAARVKGSRASSRGLRRCVCRSAAGWRRR